MIEDVGDHLLGHRSAYKQSHGHHRSGSLAIKLNEVAQWAHVSNVRKHTQKSYLKRLSEARVEILPL